MDYSRFFDTHEECLEPISTEITGNIPQWLRGKYFMNGPCRYRNEDFSMNHLFDGYSMIIKFNITDEVTFQARMVQSDAYRKFVTYGKPVYQEFGTPASVSDPEKGVLTRFISKFLPVELTDNVCGNVHAIGDEIYACSETNFLWRINKDTLETEEKVDVGKLCGVNVCCSHPHFMDDGMLYNMGSSFGASIKYQVIKVEPPRKETDSSASSGRSAYQVGSVEASESSRWSSCYSYYHSFAITNNYFILIEQCLTANIPKLAMSQIKGKAINQCLEWQPEQKTRFVVMDRKTGKTVKLKFMCDEVFVLHHVNAFEDVINELSVIVVDVVAHSSPDILDALYLEKICQKDFKYVSDSQVKRYILPLQMEKMKVSEEIIFKIKSNQDNMATATLLKPGKVWLKPCALTGKGFGVPAINYSLCNGRKYKFVYGNEEIGSGIKDTPPKLMKFNLESGEKLVWSGPNNYMIMEPKLIPEPNGQNEDSGIIIALLASFVAEVPHILIFLDASNMQEVARVKLPSKIHIPLCFHGYFLAEN